VVLFIAEELLNSFAGQPGSWRHCLYFLSNSRNEYVMMYSLTVFEVKLTLHFIILCRLTYTESILEVYFFFSAEQSCII